MRAAPILLFAMCVALAGCMPDHAKAQPAALAPAPEQPAAIVQPVVAPIAEPVVQASGGPQAALAYRADLIRTARAVWGMEAPIAAFAAQIHQESGWKPRAVSHVGAAGLAQFMPATSKWISGLYPELSENQPYNPAWAMRAMVLYDLWLFERTPRSYSRHDRLWVALRAYNGGLGHWQAEARNAATQDRSDVDAVCGSAKRARVHCKENLGYPHRILVVLQPRYTAWGPSV